MLQYVAAAERNAVDGDTLLDLSAHDNIEHGLGMASPLDQTRLRVGLKKSTRTRRHDEDADESAANKRPRSSDPVPEKSTAKSTAKSAASPSGLVTFVAKPHRALECPLCLEPVCEEPSMLKNGNCDHVACKKCLLASLRVHRHCPTCRSPAAAAPQPRAPGIFSFAARPPPAPPAEVESLIARSRLVSSMNDELQIHCPLGVVENRAPDLEAWRSSEFTVTDGCTAVVPLGELAAHLAECQFVSVPCEFAALGCSHKGLRKDMKVHLDQCWYARGEAELKASSTKFSEMQAQLDAQSEKLDEATQKLAQHGTQLSTTNVSLKVLQEHNSRLGAMARALVRERVKGDPDLFGGSLALLPSPDPERLKTFLQANSVSGAFFEDDDGTVTISGLSTLKKKRQITEFAELLPLCPTIVELSLPQSINDAKTFACLARALPQLIMLKKLDILCCALPEESIQVLGKSLPQLSLTRLSLSYLPTVFQLPAMRALASGLAECASLEELEFNQLKMDTDGFRLLSRALSKLPNLKELVFSTNSHNIKDKRGINDIGWPSFFASVANCVALKALTFNCHGFSSQTAISNLVALLQRGLLTSLSLAECGFDLGDMRKICEALRALTKLEHFDISENRMDMASTGALAVSLLRCPSLKSLMMGSTEVGSHGALALAAALPNLTNLETLDVYGCDAEPAGVTALLRAVPVCKKLDTISLDNNNAGSDAAQVLLSEILPACKDRSLDINFSHNSIGADMRSQLQAWSDDSSLHSLDLEHDGSDDSEEDGNGTEGGEGRGEDY
eukprot:COSAG06_NODE_1462_length_9381_cov_10.866731_4_plen_790_part_00